MSNIHAHTLEKLSQHLAADLKGDPHCLIHGLASLENARSGQIAYFNNARYQKFLSTTQASAVILSSEDAKHCNTNMLIVKNPQLSFVELTALFVKTPEIASGIHPTATIGKNCHIPASVSIGAQCVIGDDVHLGEHTVIHPGVTIGSHAVLGEHCTLWSHVTLYYGVKLGDRVTLHSGVVIGSDGFGLLNENGAWQKIPQLGSVNIGNDVEIGANTVVDRGTLDDTIIEDGVKLDNLIQIAHNVHIGAHTAIAACTAIAGSARIGKYCMIAGKVGINGHIEITDGVILTAGTTVSNSIKEAGIYSSGIPAHPTKEWRKNAVRFQQLDDIARRLSKLEKKSI